MGFGELGLAAVGERDAGIGLSTAQQRIKVIEKQVEDAKWANSAITFINRDATAKSSALAYTREVVRGFGNQEGGFSANNSAAAGLTLGTIESADQYVQLSQQIAVADVSLEREIRSLLGEISVLAVEVSRARNNVLSSQLQTERLLSQMDRLIEDLANARDTASNLYFQDPSFRVIASRAQRRAEGELDFAIDRLYRLARTLEYEWTEAFKNPVVIPVNCDEPPSLENPLFDKFSDLESLFVVRTADESKDYLDALRAWDAKLRRINITSVRGPNHAGPVTAEPISIREDILGLTPGAELSQERSIEQFRNFLESRLVGNRLNAANPAIEFDFATGIADNALFPADGSRWNMRIHSITVDLIAESGVSRRQVAEVDLAMSGMTTLRRFFADPPLADDLFNLTFNLGRAERSAFGVVVPARINGATGGRPATEFLVMGLKGRPIAATRWVLGIDTTNPSNRDFDYRKLKDIVIRFTYTYGNPPEFPGF